MKRLIAWGICQMQFRKILNKKEIDKILENPNLTEEVRSTLLERLSLNYKNLCFINIVEEIEQNLFPVSQRNLLNELLKFNNITEGNKLVLTTHSPYILNYLTLALKGGQIKKELDNRKASLLLKKLEKVVPLAACLLSESVNIYEFLEKGTINLLPNYQGIPSDNNYLNNSLFQINELFDALLEIEEELLVKI